MNVLSLFDGMSCGQIALQKLGIKVDKYFACEIDKYAIQVTQKNFPNTIQLGDIQFVTKETLGRHNIDLILGGSPCQGFSFAGQNLNFQDPRSALFFEFVRLVREIEPKYFLLENVKMKKQSQDIISKYMGCEPIEINSALVSAQNRRRLYWTNIPGISQPKDKGIMLKDILQFDYEDGSGVEFNENQERKIDKINPSLDKANCLTEAIGRGGSSSEFLTSVKKKTLIVNDEIKAGAYRARSYDKDGKRVDWKDSKPTQNLEVRKDEKSNSLTSVQKDNVVVKNNLYWRKITPIECERLQTVPDNYTDCVSNTQRYKMLGNGWTIDVIAHILKGIKIIDKL
jgi:site-specific DNA-cytosine methylase